jgi:hypothetical protein
MSALLETLLTSEQRASANAADRRDRHEYRSERHAALDRAELPKIARPIKSAPIRAKQGRRIDWMKPLFWDTRPASFAIGWALIVSVVTVTTILAKGL